MLHIESLILNLFLLVLKFPLNLSLDAGHKRGRFSKTLLKKSLKFLLSKGDGTITFNLGLVLLSVEVDSILEKQGYKKDVLEICSTDYVKIVLVLLAEVVVLYIGATFIQVGILGLKSHILENKICLVIFLAFNK